MKDVNENNAGKLSLEELEVLIEKYFEGETTGEEERCLRAELSDCAYRSSLIDDCLVAMGYFSVGRRAEREKTVRARMTLFRRAASAAAMTAVVLVLGLTLFKSNEVLVEDDCIAYVGGEKISDKDKVIAMVESELSSIGETVSEDRNSIMDELSGIKGILSE
ncbi:MAG: hypothetical protein IJ328_00015 [Muribaculaceae bacterium]|nr:hypothetical protein [Muribaculaceae bacterium]